MTDGAQVRNFGFSRYNSTVDCQILTKFLCGCILGLVIKMEDDCWDEQSQVAMPR